MTTDREAAKKNSVEKLLTKKFRGKHFDKKYFSLNIFFNVSNLQKILSWRISLKGVLLIQSFNLPALYKLIFVSYIDSRVNARFKVKHDYHQSWVSPTSFPGDLGERMVTKFPLPWSLIMDSVGLRRSSPFIDPCRCWVVKWCLVLAWYAILMRVEGPSVPLIRSNRANISALMEHMNDTWKANIQDDDEILSPYWKFNGIIIDNSSFIMKQLGMEDGKAPMIIYGTKKNG